MTIDDKINDEKLQFDINEKQHKYQHYLTGKIDNHE